MRPERWRRIRAVFSGVLRVPAAGRPGWLAAALPGEPSLAGEVLDLARAHDQGGEALERGALAAVPDLERELSTAVAGMRVGPYRVISELGRGGMGAVYLAVRDDDHFVQQVALKLVRRGMDTAAIVRRFVHERQILAGLAHPHIARLLDGGSTADGRPYFVLEHVAGTTITRYAAAHGLGVEARLRLMLKVASAVQYAHQNLVVHRDLKPANVLVEADGTPKLLDFGIAKLLQPDAPGGPAASALTEARERPMTPDYASPEQLEGGPVTTATDVYGLGTVLYELLVGASPRSVERRLGPGWAGRPASQAARTLGKGSPAERKILARRLRGDLDTILGKALEPDPSRRYPTAAAFAGDLLATLERRPVAARRPSFGYRLGRTVMRHKLAAALVACLAALAAGATWSAVEIAASRDRVEAERRRAEALAEFLKGLFRSVGPEESRGRLGTARQILDRGARSLLARGGPPVAAATRAGLLGEVGQVYASFGSYRDARRLLDRAWALGCSGAEPGAGSDAGLGSGTDAELACARILTRLGDVALRESRYAESRALFLRALAAKRRLLGARAPATVDDLLGLGRVATETGDLTRAAADLAAALDLARRASPPEPRRLAEAHVHLGNLAAVRGSTEEAGRHAREALRLYRAAGGDDHPDSLLARGELAANLFARGDYPAAEAQFRAILASTTRIAGPDHPEIARTLANLGAVLQAAGRLPEAEQALTAAVAMRARLGLAPDVDGARLLNSLAAVLRQQGRLVPAEAAYRRALDQFRRLSGPDHPDVANVLLGLARIRLESGDLAAARRLAGEGRDLLARALGPGHPQVGGAWGLLAEVLDRQGRPAEAEEAYRRALAIARAASPPGHPRVAKLLVGLGGVLVERGRAAAAEPFLAEGLAAYRATLPEGDERVARAEAALAECRRAAGGTGSATKP